MMIVPLLDGYMERKRLLSLVSSAAFACLGLPRLASANDSSVLNPDILEMTVPFQSQDIEITKFLGKATIVSNMKLDDPVSLQQIPNLASLSRKYGKDGLKVLLFPTDQGWFEPDENDIIRIKAYQSFGFGQYPREVVFDKVDVVGYRTHPFWQYLCRSLKNENDVARVTLNYEKFLLDSTGTPVRRYPRKWDPADLEDDVKTILLGEPLKPSPYLTKAWRDADREAEKSEYAFRFNYNYYLSDD
jgi:glutathione peroxidase